MAVCRHAPQSALKPDLGASVQEQVCAHRWLCRQHVFPAQLAATVRRHMQDWQDWKTKAESESKRPPLIPQKTAHSPHVPAVCVRTDFRAFSAGVFCFEGVATHSSQRLEMKVPAVPLFSSIRTYLIDMQKHGLPKFSTTEPPRP